MECNNKLVITQWTNRRHLIYFILLLIFFSARHLQEEMSSNTLLSFITNPPALPRYMLPNIYFKITFDKNLLLMWFKTLSFFIFSLIYIGGICVYGVIILKMFTQLKTCSKYSRDTASKYFKARSYFKIYYILRNFMNN